MKLWRYGRRIQCWIGLPHGTWIMPPAYTGVEPYRFCPRCLKGRYGSRG